MKTLIFSALLLCCLSVTYGQIPTIGNVLWLRADRGVFNDNAVTPAVIGNTVQLWADQSGNANDFVQPASAKRPEYQVQANVLCSRPVVRFDPGRRTFLSSPLLLNGAKTIYVVFIVPSINGAAYDLISIKGPGATFTEIVATDFAGYKPLTFISDLTSTVAGNLFQPSMGSSTSFSSAGNILGLFYDGVSNAVTTSYNTRYDVNAAPVLASGLLGRYPDDETTIGGRAPFQNINFLKGDIAEILVYNRQLTVLERDQVENYLVSRYGFQGTCVVLPITLHHFSAYQSGRHVKLDWEISDEESIETYIADHSTDGQNWLAIDTLPKSSEGATLSHTYTSYDQHPSPGINYYRFRMVDRDHHEKSGPVRKVTFLDQDASIININPNPASSVIEVRNTKNENDPLTGRIVDLSGREVKTFHCTGTTQLNITSLPQGVYFVHIQGRQFTTTKKLIKQ